MKTRRLFRFDDNCRSARRSTSVDVSVSRAASPRAPSTGSASVVAMLALAIGLAVATPIVATLFGDPSPPTSVVVDDGSPF